VTQVARSDLIRALVLGRTVQAAAAMLDVNRRTVTRAMTAHRIQRPSAAIIIDGDGWRRAYDLHGPFLCAMSRALGMGHSYVHRMLEEHGIRPMRDPWADKQEAAE
jgi:hypothetical protein